MSAEHRLYYVATVPPAKADRAAAECLASALGLQHVTPSTLQVPHG